MAAGSMVMTVDVESGGCGRTTKQKPASSCCSDDMAELGRALAAAELPTTVPRQDSLYRDAMSRAHQQGQGQQEEGWARTLRLAFQCVGVLYGDIGTSPLYVYSSTFTGGIRHTDDLLGVLSLIIYSFLLFTIIKYVYIALRANDDGDGGTFALYSLISRHAKVSLVPNHQAEDELTHAHAAAADDAAVVLKSSSSLRGSVRRRTTTVQLASPRDRRAQWVKDLLETSKPVRISLFLLTVVATAMVITDACLTPAISVLSAVGGLKEKAPDLTTEQIVWMTVGILLLLFGVQRFGTDKVGYLFAPVVLLWLLLIAGVGVYNLLRHDVGVLRAFNPRYIADYFRRNGRDAWVSLGGVLLCFTGTEALFADLGYFSVRSIQLSFACGLVPAVLLAYMGQAAFLRRHPAQVAEAFYRSTPEPLFWPTLVLALATSVVGSQAMISCAFATISHSQAMGCFPRVRVLHTSRHYHGQVYIPEVNFLLALAACVVTVAARGTAAVIAEAHGICVVLVMLVTTLLLTLVMLLVWRANAAWVALFFAVFAAAESAYLSSVLYRFTHGGYIPVAMSAPLVAVMALWHYVHVRRYEHELQRTVSHESVRELLARRDVVRVPGVGLFYTELVQGIPPVFPHLVHKIPSVHAVLLFVSVKHLPVPHVDAAERFLFRQVVAPAPAAGGGSDDIAGSGTTTTTGSRVFRCVARYGYRDPLEEARDFAASLVERLQYYVRDVNLYGVDHLQPGAKVSYPTSRCDSLAASMRRQRSVSTLNYNSVTTVMMRPSASYTESLALARARSTSSGAATTMVMAHSASCNNRPTAATAAAAGVFAEEMLTPAESFSELSRMGSAGGGGGIMGMAAVKMSLEEMARIEEEQRFIEREMEKGVVYILGEAEVVARPNSSLLKKIMVNYAYAFLRKNCRQGEKMLAIPKSQLLKVGMSYEI